MNTFEPGPENGHSSARVGQRGLGPDSAAKQRRSFCVPVLKHPGPWGGGAFFAADSAILCVCLL